MADALVLGASTDGVWVQVPSPAPNKKDAMWRLFLFGAKGSRKPVQRVSLCPNETRKTTLTVFFHTIFPSDGGSL